MVERRYRTATTGELWLTDSRGEAEMRFGILHGELATVAAGSVRYLL